MASNNQGGGPSNRDDDDMSNTSILSKKKTRLTNKRVSFAEDFQVRTFNTDVGVDEYYGSGLRTVDEHRPTPTRNDARTRLAFDDDGEHTAPITSALPPPSTGLNPADSMDLYNPTPDATFNGDTFNLGMSPSDMRPSNVGLRMSSNFNFGNMDDVERFEPRFSVMHDQEPMNNDDVDDDDDDDASIYQSGNRMSVQSKQGGSESRAPSILRPSLPEKRQLFSGDIDDTIHFDAPTSSSKELASASRGDAHTPVPSEKRSRIGDVTPASALGRRIQEAALLRSAGRAPGNAALTVEHSILEEPADNAIKFPLLDKFLRDAGAESHKDLLPKKPEPQEFAQETSYNLNTLEGRIGAGVMKTSIYDRLNKANNEIQSKIASVQEEIKSLSISIENNPPSVITKLSKDGDMGNEEKMNMKIGFTRLKRFVTMKTKKDWYQYRTQLEQEMIQSLKETDDTMKEEVGKMKTMADKMTEMRKRLEEELKDVQLPGDDKWVEASSVPVDDQLAVELRENMRERYALSRRRQEENNREEVIREKMEEVDKDVRRLEKACEESRKRLDEGPIVTIQHHDREVQRRRNLLSSVTGIRTLSAKPSTAVFCVSDLADVTVTMAGTQITGLSVEYVPLGEGVLPAIKTFLEDAVTLVNSCIVNVTQLSHLRIVLHLMATHLESAKRAGLAVCNYIDLHGIEFDDVEVDEDSVYSELRLNPSFYCLKKGVKFGAIVVLKFYPPIFNGSVGKWELAKNEVEVSQIQDIIDTPPSLQIVDKIVQETEGDICAKLRQVWTVFQNDEMVDVTTPMAIET